MNIEGGKKDRALEDDFDPNVDEAIDIPNQKKKKNSSLPSSSKNQGGGGNRADAAAAAAAAAAASSSSSAEEFDEEDSGLLNSSVNAHQARIQKRTEYERKTVLQMRRVLQAMSSLAALALVASSIVQIIFVVVEEVRSRQTGGADSPSDDDNVVRNIDLVETLIFIAFQLFSIAIYLTNVFVFQKKSNSIPALVTVS